jgi:DNA-binding LytR/AlgR family response regulator
MKTQTSHLSKPTDHRLRIDRLPASEIFDSSYVLPSLSLPDKKSFLVFKHNKYLTVRTESIAFFYIRYDATLIVCFDKQEYSVNYSLEHIQQVLSASQFFRLNRQYLINFNAVKEVERYFARKLLVRLAIKDEPKLLVSKEKATSFLRWLENR